MKRFEALSAELDANLAEIRRLTADLKRITGLK